MNADSMDWFSTSKKKVLDFARKLRDTAARRKDNNAVAVLDRLLRRLDENQFLVVVAGEFKHGKSTLVNALAKRTVCPVHITPQTARVTRILASPDEPEYFNVHFRDEREPERHALESDSVKDFVVHGGQRVGDVSRVDVYLQPDRTVLYGGVILVDTPGLDSIFKNHDEITREYLPRADLVVFCYLPGHLLERTSGTSCSSTATC